VVVRSVLDSHSVVANHGAVEPAARYRLFNPAGRKGWTSPAGIDWQEYRLNMYSFGDRSTAWPS
jgi:hypothetical protein